MMRRNKSSEFRVQSSELPVQTTPQLSTPKLVTPQGFTLTEVMVVATIMGILAGIAVPALRRAVFERGYWRGAVDVLGTIYAGERMYFFQNDTYRPIPPGAWDDIDIDNPNDPNLDDSPVTFKVTVCNPPACVPATFTAKADRGGGQALTVNQDRQWCGALAVPTSCPSWPMP